MSKTHDILKNIDKGFFHDARLRGMTPGAFLAQQVEPEAPETEKVYQRLLKRYQAADDASFRAFMLRQYAEEVTALEKCFAERGIRAAGPYCDTVEKAFFSSANDSALFPVFLATELIAGQLAGSLVPRLAAMEQRINAHVAEKVTMSEVAADRTLKFTGEGASLPKTSISKTTGNVTLFKYGRLLEWTYESARLMTLDIVGRFIQRMGIQIGVDETDDLIEALIAGDGTASSAVTDTDADATGVLDWDEWIKLYQAAPIGYTFNEAVCNDTNLRTTFNLAEFKDPLAGYNVQRDGLAEPRIFGMRVNRWASTGSASFSTDRILTVDSRFAVKVIREGDLLEEADRIIDKQLNQRAMSEWVGYMKLDNSATGCLDITT